jgi:hypothetical protein
VECPVLRKWTVAWGQNSCLAPTVKHSLAVSSNPKMSPLWVKLNFKVGDVAALVDKEAQFTCIGFYVLVLCCPNIKCEFSSCSLTCFVANGLDCNVTQSVTLHFKLQNYSWDHQFRILEGGLFLII